MRSCVALLALCLLLCSICHAEGTEVMLIENGKTSFTLIYDAKDMVMRMKVTAFTERVYEDTGLSIRAKNVARVETPGEHELVLGKVRDGAAPLSERLVENDFIVAMQDGHLYCVASDAENFDYLLEWLFHSFFAEKKDVALPEGYVFQRSHSELTNTSYAAYYREKNGTYGSLVDEFRAKNLRVEDKRDQDMIEALIGRMGDGFAVYPGSSSVLYQGNIGKLDTEDYSHYAIMKDGQLLIPKEFALHYFGSDIPVADGYCDVTAYCKHNDYSLFYHEKLNIAVVTPAETPAFQPKQQLGTITDDTYLRRMKQFFENPYLPEPALNVEQTRSVVKATAYQDAENCANWRDVEYDSYYDPAITVVQEDGKTVLYALHTVKHFMDNVGSGGNTELFVSYDMGQTWTQIASFSSMGYAESIVKIGDRVYLIGGFSNVQIAYYDVKTGETDSMTFGTTGKSGPGTLLVHEGRVYKPYGDTIISADVDSNLMDASSWTFSEAVSPFFTREWLDRIGLTGSGWLAGDGTHVNWEEGNMLPGKDGKLYVVYRTNTTRGCALVLEVSKDGKELAYVTEVNGVKLPKTSYIKIPSAKSRHTMRYDESTGMYISLMNIYTGDSATQYAWTDMQQRTVLALCVSSDLVNWETREILLVDRVMMNPVLSVFAHGFQYADFGWDGENIYFVIRENSGEKTYNYHHEANFTTSYVIKNYQKYVKED